MADVPLERPVTRRRFRPCLLAVLLLAIPQASGLTQEQSDRYQFRVTVDLISLNVTVTDTGNRFVTDLLQDDFSVFEDGISQDISVFSREDLPIRMVLLVDTSASMDEKMTFAQEAAINFVAQMKDDDLTEVVEFGSKAHVLQPFTADIDQLRRAIRMTQAGGTTSLYNASLYRAQEPDAAQAGHPSSGHRRAIRRGGYELSRDLRAGHGAQQGHRCNDLYHLTEGVRARGEVEPSLKRSTS